MLINKIVLKNFKSHSNSEISFSKITTIVPGNPKFPNSCGKSNILDALKVILYASPFPASWIRHGAKESTVTAFLSNGYIITRSRTKNKQSTEIKKPTGEIELFEGIRDASAFIQSITGVTKLSLGEEEIDLNFIGSREAYFLTQDSPSSVRRKLLILLGISSIEEAKTKLTKQKRALSKELQFLETNLAQRESGSLLSCDLGSSEVLLNLLDDLLKEEEEAQDKLNKAKDTVYKLHNLSKYNTQKDLVKVKSSLKLLQEKMVLFKDLSESLNKVKSIGSKKALLDKKLTELQLDISQTKEQLTNKEEQRSRIIKELGYCPICLKS